MSSSTIAIIGGGAAGFFAALTAAHQDPSLRIVIFEKTKELLTKVRISGGGRCNVTHNCFDPKRLVHSYPRGQKELLGPFTRFQPQDTVDWFESHGVTLKTEKDGRVFPTTDQSQTIIDCLLAEAKQNNIEIRTQCRIDAIKPGFILELGSGETFSCDQILLATGGGPQGHELASSLGHRIISPIPSLFTFNVPDSPLKDLSGLSLEYVTLTLPGTSLKESGPLLLTHFGFSGPCALRLSAWGARYFHEHNYQVPLHINWAPNHDIYQELIAFKAENPNQIVCGRNPLNIPKKLWKRLTEIIGFSEQKTWGNTPHKEIEMLAKKLENDIYTISGKTVNKEEFVTAGGIDLKEINFKTMESRIQPGLFFAGEVLDIDGITGGFNFQNAWTTGYLAGMAMVDLLRNSIR